MTGPPPIQQAGDCVTIRGATTLAAAYRATLAGITRRRAAACPAATCSSWRGRCAAHTSTRRRSRDISWPIRRLPRHAQTARTATTGLASLLRPTVYQ